MNFQKTKIKKYEPQKLFSHFQFFFSKEKAAFKI